MNYEKETGMTGIWGILILVFLFFIVFTGDGLFGRRDNGYVNAVNGCGCSGTSNCEVEKQTIINTATTQNLINDQAEKTRSQATSLYIQDQAEKTFDLKINAQTTAILNGQALQAKDSEIAMLKNMRYNDAKFDVIERQLSSLSCELPKRPPYYAQGFVTTAERIPSGCGIC